MKNTTDKTKKAVLISNLGEARELSIDLDSSMKGYLIDADNMMTETDYDSTCFTIQKNQVIFIRFHPLLVFYTVFYKFSTTFCPILGGTAFPICLCCDVIPP